jgi:putative FmdB family regulatory protein
MPVYAYSCRKCGYKFESIRGNNENDKDVECPICGSKDPVRMISLFSGINSKGSGGYPRRFG